MTNQKKNGTIEKSSTRGCSIIQAPGSLRSARWSLKTKGMVTILPRARTKQRGDTTMFEDKTLVCKDCGKEFVWTAGEQEFYASRGFENQPQRCKPCRRDSRLHLGRHLHRRHRHARNAPLHGSGSCQLFYLILWAASRPGKPCPMACFPHLPADAGSGADRLEPGSHPTGISQQEGTCLA